MKKNYFYLIGFIIIMIVNYFIKKYSNHDYSENLNQINLYDIIENGLRPIGIFLLINFFSRKGMKIQTFAIFILVIMIIESMFRYFNDKSIIEYNYTIGMIIGLILVYFIDMIKNKIIDKPQLTNN
ncbi:hypothetical protein SAMN05444411_1345 [Lutibacter oricola]|uniref:VanZ like family protein n=1 Tax=Lutibacter oricola TaxID=762486 RepID=A0A1H3HDD1_9FLAO|nr:hypothetical protein [Lutibacter oricola]SDY13472.1 hypothetical protein SAMN05444411_1345 [Lutibacter oricola]